MPEFDPRNPLQRPTTPPTTSWFEFLLDWSLLDKHLNKENHDPSATELLALFLYQADLATSALKDNIVTDYNATNGVLDVVAEPEVTESEKMKALRLLALRVAAHLQWDLNVLRDSVPVTMVFGILTELLRATGLTDANTKTHLLLNIATLPDEAYFSLQIFHRWIIRTAVQEAFPVRVSKVTKVQVPGLLDPSVTAANGKEPLIAMVTDSLSDSLLILEACLSCARDVRIPSMQCFGALDETTHIASHDWSRGNPVDVNEITCQISYDLGCCYFHQEKYSHAADMFSHTSQLLKQGSTVIDHSRLIGYCNALGDLIRPFNQMTLHDKMEQCRRHGYQGIVLLLLEDNESREVSLTYRSSIADEVSTLDSVLHSEVVICNVVRAAIEAQMFTAQFTQQFLQHTSQHEFFIKACVSVLDSCSEQQKSHIKHLLQYACLSITDGSTSLPTMLLAVTALKCLFSPHEVATLQSIGRSPQQITEPSITTNRQQSSESCVRLSEIERTLLTTYVPSLIKDCVHKLLHKTSKKQLMYLDEKWRIPRELSHVIENLPIPLVQVCTHILIAKALICCKLQLFDMGRDLLAAADVTAKDISYKLSKLLRNELLRCDLLRYRLIGRLPINQSLQDLVKKVKTCFTSLQLDRDMKPGADVISECISLLVNIREWSYLADIVNNNNGCLTLSCLLSNMCRELPNINNARKPARELWEAIVLICTGNQPQSQSSSRRGNDMSSRHDLGILPQSEFLQFILTISEPMNISILISCLCKLFNMLDDTISCEISSEYSTLWPTALGNASTISVPFVSSSVMAIMEHALTLDPCHAAWLRTQADIHFAHGEYSQSLKFYLQVGVVGTDFFTEPVPKHVYDDLVYKRMIKSCSYLQCHTQVAVLCQMLDDMDYTTAFKALQEKVCYDAMDTNYEFIWDVTLLEYIIHTHGKRGELDKQNMAMKIIGTLELNNSNPPEILYEAAKLRKANFLRAMAKQYL